MHREEFELFIEEVDQYVYDLSNRSKENSESKNCEMAITSIELLIMRKMKKMCKVYLTGLLEVGVAKDDDFMDLHVIIGSFTNVFFIIYD